MKLGETSMEGVKREILEETGLDVTVGPIVDVVDVMVRADGSSFDLMRHSIEEIEYHYTIVEYLIPVQSDAIQNAKAASDAVELKWVNEEDLYQMTDLSTHLIKPVAKKAFQLLDKIN
uniref:Nudix hydrolase domain-containing protein n=1 Tax=Arcella intermedia TaxID=1963864 RepID=A0A6B2LN30_9EUKA